MKGSNCDSNTDIDVQPFCTLSSKEKKEMEKKSQDLVLNHSVSPTSIQNNISQNELSRLIISLQNELSCKTEKIMKIQMEKARNNKVLDSYRDTLRSKNCTIKTLERQICELRQIQYSSSRVLKTEETAKKYDQKKSDIEVKKYTDLISSLTIENRKYQIRINEYYDEEKEYQEQISDLTRDLRLVQKKMKLVKLSQLIEHEIFQKEESSENCKEEIEIKEVTNTKLAYELTKLKKSNFDYQEKIFDIRYDILRLEKIVSESQYEKTMLKYQLSIARDVAISSEINEPVVSLEKNGMNYSSVTNNFNIKAAESKQVELVAQDLSDAVMATPQKVEELSVEEIVPDSQKTKLYNESKGDEYIPLNYDDIDISNMGKKVVLKIPPHKPVDNTIVSNNIGTETLPNKLNRKKQNETNDVKLSIMEKLSESQQEAIGSLTRSLEELRRDLSNELELRHNISAIADRKKLESESLKKENELFAVEIVSTEREMEKLRNTLYAKLGENACLRDEIHELEYKLNEKSTRDDLTKKSYQNKIHDLELIISGKKIVPSSQCNNKSIDISSSIQVQHEHEISEVEKKIKRRYEDIFNILEEKAKSYQDRINKVESLLFERKESLMTNTTIHSNDEDSLSKPHKRRERELFMLKKALKQKYEDKFEELDIKLERKKSEITHLRGSITNYQETLTQHREEIEQQRCARISQEAEYSEREQELMDNLAKRDEQIVQLKLKLARPNGSYRNDADAWEKVSNTVSAGVTVGIDMLSMLSLTPERNNLKKKQNSKQ